MHLNLPHNNFPKWNLTIIISITLGKVILTKMGHLLFRSSIMASLVVIPCVVIISVCFSESRDKDDVKTQKQESKKITHRRGCCMCLSCSKCCKKNIPKESAVIDDDNDAAKTAKYNARPKRLRVLPWWVVIFSWLMCFCATLTSAFFVMLYSFTWGGVKSSGWLVTFMMSFVQDIIIIQPIKVS